MLDITLQQLLEAGCHFGHKSERWNPKANEFIYTVKDGVHIIDLGKTKTGLDAAQQYIYDLVKSGGEVLFVGTKRQASGLIKTLAETSGAFYFSDRWIGGFLTNWESIKKNIEKINKLEFDREAGNWKKFPKHEQVKLSRYIENLKVYYGGVLKMTKIPDAIFIIDVKREVSAVREAIRVGIPIIAIVDTNSNPTGVTYPIPANDDAVGSIELLTKAVIGAYQDGKDARAKDEPVLVSAPKQELPIEEKKPSGMVEVKSEPENVKVEKKDSDVPVLVKPKKRGRPAKVKGETT